MLTKNLFNFLIILSSMWKITCGGENEKSLLSYLNLYINHRIYFIYSTTAILVVSLIERENHELGILQDANFEVENANSVSFIHGICLLYFFV